MEEETAKAKRRLVRFGKAAIDPTKVVGYLLFQGSGSTEVLNVYLEGAGRPMLIPLEYHDSFKDFIARQFDVEVMEKKSPHSQ